MTPPKDYSPPTNLTALRERIEARIERFDRLVTNALFFAAGIVVGTAIMVMLKWILI